MHMHAMYYHISLFSADDKNINNLYDYLSIYHVIVCVVDKYTVYWVSKNTFLKVQNHRKTQMFKKYQIFNLLYIKFP